MKSSVVMIRLIRAKYFLFFIVFLVFNKDKPKGDSAQKHTVVSGQFSC